MKIVLLGNNQFAVSVAWGLCHLEVVREVAFVSDTASSKNRFVHAKEAAPASLRDLVEANALSASDTAISVYNSLEGLSNADVVVLLPPMGQSGFRSPQASKTTGIAFARGFVPGIQQYASDAKILVAGISCELYCCVDISGTRYWTGYRSWKRCCYCTPNCCNCEPHQSFSERCDGFDYRKRSRDIPSSTILPGQWYSNCPTNA